MNRRLLIAGGLLILLGAGGWFYGWWHSPAETKEFIATQTTGGVLGSETALQAWQTSYFSTRYPDEFRVINANEVAHGIAEGQYLLGAISPRLTDQLAVTVGRLPVASPLDELPAVKLRQRGSEYGVRQWPFAPEGGVGFMKADGSELALFWEDAGRYAGVVSSGSSARQAELEQALEAVVTNWQWRP